ncbi:MAG: hypothetical protein NPIRA01_37570 [Nitrospirales bacterium]|nr:MAG: hypothetical protein NPIRA01_37570 [Nitrospirales bacterium]
MTILPLVFAWSVSSAVFWTVRSYLGGGENLAATVQVRKSLILRRDTWHGKPAWSKTDGSPIVVALALSGGGYRAALIHAGLLKAFDQECVPVRYLTTVSGGSIVGGYYSLGYTPDEFKTKLEQFRPHLADELFSASSLLSEFYAFDWTYTNTYVEHLRKIYFGSTTLGSEELKGSKLRLVINATDLDKKQEGAREVFFQGNYWQTEQTLLAETVAASGAFPGIFQPLPLYWPHKNLGSPSLEVLGKRKFVDGGVVENFGITGLSRYLEKTGLPPPDILVVSNASKYIKRWPLRRESEYLFPILRNPPKQEVIDLLLKSQNITYSVNDRLMIDLMLNGKPGWLSRNLGTPHVLFATSTSLEAANKLQNRKLVYKDGHGKLIDAYHTALTVAAYDTLEELSPRQVNMAFWVGYQFGLLYLEELDLIRQKLGGMGRSCLSSKIAAPDGKI